MFYLYDVLCFIPSVELFAFCLDTLPNKMRMMAKTDSGNMTAKIDREDDVVFAKYSFFFVFLAIHLSSSFYLYCRP